MENRRKNTGSAVDIDLAAGTGAAAASDDVFIDIEIVLASPSYDSVIGGPGSNEFVGSAGDDTVTGSAIGLIKNRTSISAVSCRMCLFMEAFNSRTDRRPY